MIITFYFTNVWFPRKAESLFFTSLLNRVPRVPRLPSTLQVFQCPSALTAWVPKFSSSAPVPYVLDCPSFEVPWVPECPSVLPVPTCLKYSSEKVPWVLNCPWSALGVLLECPLSPLRVLKLLVRDHGVSFVFSSALWVLFK